MVRTFLLPTKIIEGLIDTTDAGDATTMGIEFETHLALSQMQIEAFPGAML
jgi:hypothetical protein